MVPSNLEHHVSSSQPRLGSRLFVYTPVCGALTFPLPTSTSRKNLLTKIALLPQTASRLSTLPPASFRCVEFFQTQCFRLTAFNLRQPVGPICLMAYLTVVVDQRVRVSFSGDLLLSGISKLARQPCVLLYCLKFF